MLREYDEEWCEVSVETFITVRIVIRIQAVHTGTTYAKNRDYILGVVFHPKPSSVSDVAGIQSVHASLN